MAYKVSESVFLDTERCKIAWEICEIHYPFPLSQNIIERTVILVNYPSMGFGDAGTLHTVPNQKSVKNPWNGESADSAFCLSNAVKRRVKTKSLNLLLRLAVVGFFSCAV